ncbi:recombination protein RecR [Lichenibacterium minor]|uniref:Recombination protein RecR n=1 Tax=Lichenibacterium minor TaxID=2316528 RepID=A0A4Q2U3R0_9HYPH|nr:recombination protein RecR [Lichenibacterium minor]
MHCPVCQADLLMSERLGVEIDYCPKCRGVWLDRGELDKIIAMSERQTAPAAQPIPPSSPPSSPGFLPPPPQAGAWASPPVTGGYPVYPARDDHYGERYDSHGGSHHGGGHGGGHGSGHGGGHDQGGLLSRIFR